MLLLVLVLLSTSVSSCPDTAQGLHREHRHWYGLTGDEAFDSGDLRGIWPAKYTSGEGHTEIIRPIRYCWVDTKSYKALKDILEVAISKWQPAMDVSQLRIILSNAHDKAGKNICARKGVEGDALRIKDTTGTKGGTHSTVGYKVPSSADSTDGANVLMFTRSNIEDQDNQVFTHELGHSIGLSHEFSRPDRDLWLTFNCENLKDYEEAKGKIPNADHPGDTIEKACADVWTAQRYGFHAEQFLPNPTGSQLVIDHSKKFDFQSIMLYDSFAGGKGKADGLVFPRDAVLVQHADESGQPLQPPGTYRRLRVGGSMNKRLSKPSAGDIAKIAQMYKDLSNPESVRIAGDPEWALA